MRTSPSGAEETKGDVLKVRAFSSDASLELRSVVIAILAKDKAHVLPTYLRCIEKLQYPKNKIHLYVRTNNNNDATEAILAEWIVRLGREYASVTFDTSRVEEAIERFGQHEWNAERFAVLAKIRQDSVEHAVQHSSDYFVVDCDNFVRPETLRAMMHAADESGARVIAPLLHSSHTGGLYSNYHSAIDANGYYAEEARFHQIRNREPEYIGLVPVPVVHCAYYVHRDVLRHVRYANPDNANDGRHEYVLFSENLRKARVAQYVDTRQSYGFITFAETKLMLESEPWWSEWADRAAAHDRAAAIREGGGE